MLAGSPTSPVARTPSGNPEVYAIAIDRLHLPVVMGWYDDRPLVAARTGLPGYEVEPELLRYLSVPQLNYLWNTYGVDPRRPDDWDKRVPVLGHNIPTPIRLPGAADFYRPTLKITGRRLVS